MSADRFPWSYRNADWVLGIIGYIADLDKGTWAEVVDHFTDDEHQWRTVEKVIYDLLVFGVIRRAGRDHRGLAITTLGRAWLDGIIIPIPTTDSEE